MKKVIQTSIFGLELLDLLSERIDQVFHVRDAARSTFESSRRRHQNHWRELIAANLSHEGRKRGTWRLHEGENATLLVQHTWNLVVHKVHSHNAKIAR